MHQSDKGKYGETIACGYLKGKGYVIHATRYKCPCGEIDIIAENSETLVFAEVKLRKGTKAGRGAAAVTKTKQRRIIKTALHYIAKEGGTHSGAYRFDVLEIWGGEFYDVLHIENAFYADGTL